MDLTLLFYRFLCGMMVNADFVQGIPLGLALGSLPFIMKAKLSFSDLGLFSLASYPYSLKLFWSPIVDSFYFKGSSQIYLCLSPVRRFSLT